MHATRAYQQGRGLPAGIDSEHAMQNVLPAPQEFVRHKCTAPKRTCQSMDSRHALAAALVSMVASIVLVVNTAADPTSASTAVAAVEPHKPLIVVNMLPAGQRQAQLWHQLLQCKC